MYSSQHATAMSRQEHPRGHLPSWQRSDLTDQLRKGGKIRQLQPNASALKIPSTKPSSDHLVDLLEGERNALVNQEKVSMLERRMEFIRSQHCDTLSHLHKELERLKADNKELNFKLVMCRCGGNPGLSREGHRSRQQLHRRPTPGKVSSSDKPEQENVAITTNEEDLQGLRDALQKEKKRNARLMRVIEKMMQRSFNDDSTHGDSSHRIVLMNIGDNLAEEESKRIIEHLVLITERQTQEIAQLKSDFCDLLNSEELPTTGAAPLLSSKGDTSLLPTINHPNLPSNESRIMLPYITVKDDSKKRDLYDHPVHQHTLQLPALKPRGSRHRHDNSRRSIAAVHQQRTRLGTFPR